MSDDRQYGPPAEAQAPGEEWRRVPSTMLITWHPDDGLWIAEDLTRRGAWASGATPDSALEALREAVTTYDETFETRSNSGGARPVTSTSPRGGQILS
jgi:predicted RNase H-like HicB family nuclease